jgi:hypothetical protein
MAFIVIYPGVAMLAMFIVLVIMVLLRYGPQICKVRHTALPDDKELGEDHAYEQRVSSF